MGNHQSWLRGDPLFSPRDSGIGVKRETPLSYSKVVYILLPTGGRWL